ncbi:ATP-binding cassette sub-family A member 13 [Coturnix japonica]|uniref:ATP-binding cassette sub-family A member 13 n=1 Tax=Coturnix japonica TaxID=93934 RepID=UPI0013A5E2A0|nr:ATP-binding cassette sub-family A member 13 [Coturnix japonica]
MGHALCQFKALFWKNWLCRVRQPVLSLSEILWPCMLFLILAAVRVQEPPKYKENCYLEARDLPSRGLYPFVRSLFCNVGSRCRNTSYSKQKNNRLHTSAVESGSESFTGPDVALMKEIQELAKGFIETTEKTLALEKLWEESSKFSGLHNSTAFLTMDLNEAEEIISKIENLYKQPSFWNLLHSLPRLESKNVYTEDGLAAIAQFLEIIKNILASLKDLAVMPLGQTFHEVLKIALNLTAASVQERSLEGFQYNLSLEDILWNPHAVRAELESRFGFDDLHVKKLLSYTAQLKEIPEGETLEQFVCSALSSVPGDEANKENNEESCISTQQEAKLYLFYAVSKLRIYAQVDFRVFQQWFSSSHSQDLLSELERIMADLMSQLLENKEAGKIVSEISTLIRQWDKKSQAYFSEDYNAPHDLILYLKKMQAVLQAVPQWSVVKRLRLVDGALRNVVTQYLNFTDGKDAWWLLVTCSVQRHLLQGSAYVFACVTYFLYVVMGNCLTEALRSLEKLVPFSQRNESVHLDIKMLFVELKQMLMSSSSYVCADVVTMFGKALRHPQISDSTDNLAIYMCTGNDSEEAFKQSNQLQSLREAVLLLQKVTQGQQNLPDSIVDDYLGWQEIEEELAENYAYYCESNPLLSAEDVHFSSCEEQLLFSLINITLEEFFFTFEENPYWKYLTMFVQWMCEVAQYTDEEAGSTGDQFGGVEASLCSRQKLGLETILGHYLLVFLQDLPDYSSFISWARNLTLIKEFLETEDNVWNSSEKEMDRILHLAEVIEEIVMFDFSALSSLQTLMEAALSKVIMWMKGEESTINVSLAVSELYNEIQKNLQAHLRFWMKEKTDFFWQMVKIVSHELDSRFSHISQVEVKEVLETLSRFIFTENEKSLNRSMQVLKIILNDWQDLNRPTLNHLKYISENFLRNLYEILSFADSHVNESFSVGHGVSNTSFSLLSNATFIHKVQELGKIVPNFFNDIQKLNISSVDSLFQILFSLYQNADLLLNAESNNTLLMFLYNTSKDISSFQTWNDLQDVDQVSDFLSETFDLLWNFTTKSFCEKLLIFYNYTEFQAHSFVQEGKKELQVVYNILSNLKTLFLDEDLEEAAFCYLEHFFDISPECIVNKGCIGFYLSNITSVNDSAEVYNLLLPLDIVLYNVTKLEDKVSVYSALHCTFTWLQTWTEIFEETSKILNLNSTFFIYLRNDLRNLSDSFLNTTHIELCNKTTMAIVEATSAMNLLKMIVEGGNSSDWKDFETYLSIIQSVFGNAIDAASSLKGNSSDDAIEMIEAVITELQQSVLKVVNRDVLNLWLNTFISGGPEGERSSSEFSIGNSLSTILKLSQKELGFVFAELKDAAAFLTFEPLDKYLVCASVFQNITKLIFDSTLKNIDYSQVNFSFHTHSFLKSYSVINGVEDCDGWIHGLHRLSEKYKSPSYLESAKHILFLLKSLGNTETDAKLKNVVDFLNLIFSFLIPECSVTGSDVICANVYFNIIARTLEVVLPEFTVQNDTNVLEYIFTLLNNSGGLIQMAVNNLMGHSQYTSNDTHFNHLIHGYNSTLRTFLNPFHGVLLSSIELLSEIKCLLKNKTFEMQESSSSPLDIETDEKNIGLLMEIFETVVSKLNKFNLNLPHELQGKYNMFFERLMEKAALNGKLVGKALKIFKSSNLTSFPVRDDREFLEHVITLVQNLKNMDIEFLIGHFKQAQRSLDNFFKNIKPLLIENSELEMLIEWWNAFENGSCNWNLTGLWHIMQVFQEDLSDVEEMYHLLLDVISLMESLTHGNITEALAEVYTFVLTQEEKMPMYTDVEISNQVESLLMLLEMLTDVPDEHAEALVCFSAEFCWIPTTVTPQSDPTSKPCDVMQNNFSLNHNAVLQIIKQLKLITLNDSFLCTMEDVQTDITHNLTCFFHHIKEWNSILLKFSELHHINSSLLKELLAFWDELYLYAVPLQANNTNSTVNCFSTPKRRVALQIIETLSSMPAAEMEMSEYVLEQLNDLYGGLSWNRHSRISLIETVFLYVKNMTSEISGFLNTEAVYSFLSVLQPLMTLPPSGNQAYSVLMVLSSLNGNSNISENIENIWFPVVKSIEDLLNFNVRQSLAVLDQEFQLLRLATGQPSSVSLDVLIQQFNTSSVAAVLRKLEDIQEIMNSFLCECNNQNYSKVMQPVVLLMANEKSSDLLLVVKDIIDFLELFQNKSKEDYTEEPVVTSNLFCVVTQCKEGIMHHLFISIIEGITLVQDHYQSIERMWMTSNKGDCESMAHINLKLSNNVESFLRAFQNTTDGSCDCQLMLENIQRRLQKLIENWEIQLSENPVVAFLSNFNLLNDMKVKDYVQNITELRLGILSSVNISEETISIILEANISFTKVFYSAFVVAFTQRCDEEVLSLLLKLPENSNTSLAVEELCSLPALDLYTTFVLIIQNLNLRHIIYMNKIPSEMGNVLNTLLDVVSSISSLLNKVQHVMENLPAFLQAIQNSGMFDISALQQFLQGGQFRSSAVGSLKSVIKAVCKEESPFFSNANLFVDMPRVTGLLEDNMGKYGIPEDSTPFCLRLYQEILQSSNGALVWTFLKPLLHGKILYNSNVSKIDLVIEKANFTFGFVENLKTYSQAWLRMAEVFKNRGNVLMISRLQEALQNNFVKHFVESNLDIDLEKLFQKMQLYEMMMGKTLNSSASRQIDLLSQLIVNISSCVLLDRFQPFESVDKLEEKAHELMHQNNFLASIIFSAPKNKTPDSSNLLTQHISYTIRTSILYSMRTDLIKNPAWKSHPQKLPSDGFKYNHIFIPLQDMIERAIISAQTGLDISEPAIQVQAMPYPCHTSDLFLNNIGFFFPLMMMLTWMVSVASMVRKLVYEKEIHLEEYMKTMGVHPAIHFFAWFLENVIVLTISSCALVVILKASGIFAYSNGFLVFLFLLDFGVTVIMLSYFLGVFFRSANTAALCASLVYMISFLPYIVLLVLQNQLSFTKQIIMCLLSTTAFGQGVFFITFFEGQEIGIQWNNMYQPMVQGGYMTFGCTCWMMFFDSIFYSVGGWYFSNIILGKDGLRNCWYFPFTVSYWKNLCGLERMRKHYLNSNVFFFNENFKQKDLESPGWKGTCTEGATIGVVLLSLTKEHMDNHKAAVKDLSLTFHKGQITALLGPNGAGKTTVISLLTGLYPPSSGTILINGKDIQTDLAAIRSELGVCPQYDVLFNILTVREHLLLYGSVKAPGWTNEQLNQQVSSALEDVDLSQHQYKPVGALSGGMKRRLSIAISFIGNSKTVVLDEPTSGVDPCSRRSIWDVLLKYKAGCTLIFTTHHLDEAEVLSDRIAILQQGQLRCYGSPSYLRETYGQGHSLTLIKKPSVFEIQDPKHVVQVTSLVQTHIPEAFLKENSGTELTYVVPERADKTSFKGLFQALDQSLHHLHVAGYGISDTTLEEVFLKLLQDSEKMPFVPQGARLNNSKDGEPAYISLMETSRMCGTNLILAQIVALLLKRFHHIRRDWRGSLSNVLLPVLFVALAMALFSVKPLAIDYPSLKLTPGLYKNAESFFSTEDDNLGNLSQILLRYFFDGDFTCMHSMQGKSNSCWQMESQTLLNSCGCMSAKEMCPSFNTSVPYMKNKRGHILYDLSGLIMEEYLVRSSNKARYGGWSFGRKKASEYREQKWNNIKSKPLVKVWYNQKGFHSLPSYLNELNNFILWLNLPPTVDWRQYGITLYSQPYGGTLLDEDKIMENVRQCGVALCVMLGFSILTASIGSAVVKERVTGAKRLQHITGMGYKTYWLANFCCDMLFYMLPVTLCVCVITAFQLSAFTFRNNLAATVILLVLFGYATLPWMYLVSRFFSSSDVAFISYISLNFVFGLCTMLVTLLPRLLTIISKVQSFQNIYKILKWAFIIFPQFCLGQGLIELSYNQIKFDLTSNFGIDSYVSPFEMNFLGWIFVEMALQGTVLLLLRLFFHWDLLQKPRSQHSVNSLVNPSEDIDVEMERQRLFGGRTHNDVLLLYNLRKSYGGFSKKNTAVENISLGITKGECFGLLGTNGAGKSTTFKMLTGDIVPSAGRAVIRTPTGSEVDILSASSEGILIGYCPQQDALDELLTGWEHLNYYCTLRGIPKQHICKVAEDLVNRLQLNAHADKLVRTYSAGTKRKLSAALALVGKPQILLLDEPSSGMDPCSKRYLWKTILKEVQDGCAAVLTSHSMEECEALCTRLAIMVNGSFKCLGSPQHIKNRFGDGYSVKVWLSKEISYQKMILDCLKLHFPGSQFKGQHLNLLEYHVPRSEGCLAELFRILENYKAFLQIKHYSISQTTLEQVFINFATQQQGISLSSQESPTVRQGHLAV